jgi:hypothetical protein
VDARRTNAGHDQIAPLHMRMRGYGHRQALQAFQPK